MTQIADRQSHENRKYEVAKAIRKLLDEYLANIKDASERDDAETFILDLVVCQDE